MKSRALFSFIFFVLLLATGYNSLAQRDKKKKPDTDSKLSESRLREAEFFFTEAEKYFILEDYTKALLYYQRTMELNPENATVHYKIAEVLSRSNKEDDLIKASISIDNALKLEKKNKYFYLLASNIYNNLTQFSKSAQVIETMMKELPGSEEYLYELAAVYQYDHKPEEALKVYNRAESILGINEMSSINKQRIYLEQGKVNEAIAEGEKLIDTFPDEERYVLGFAETLSQNGQAARAIPFIEKYLQGHPEAGSAKMLLAGLYRDTKQEEKARQYILSVFDDPSVDVSSKVLMLGSYSTQLTDQVNKKVNDPSLEAFTFTLFEKLKKTHPNDPNVHLIGGDLYLTLKKNPEAQEEYLKSIRLGTSSFEAWQNLLYLESEANQLDSLIVHSEEGLESFPNQGVLYYFNGYAHLRKKHYREAVTAFEQAKKMSASNPGLAQEISSMLGDAYNGTREYEKSDKAYDEALEFNPNNYFVLNNYSYYLALRNANLEKAEKMAALLIKGNPDNTSYLDTYAWVLYMRAKYKEAKKVMEKALSQGQVSATHYEHYGDILFQLGDIDGAVKQWQKAKSMSGDNELIDKKIANRRLY
ncbi:MAG TPA: tetratricopeptide repeat protein [Cyclobacteriaceae bacterium]